MRSYSREVIMMLYIEIKLLSIMNYECHLLGSIVLVVEDVYQPYLIDFWASCTSYFKVQTEVQLSR